MTPTSDPARQAALTMLNAIVPGGALLSEASPGALRGLSPGDRARATRLALETLRWADRADRMLGPYLRMKPYDEVLNALRLGVVSICHLGEPAHGVVNDLVTLMKAHQRMKGGAGLTNAVLRKIDSVRTTWNGLPSPRLAKWLRKPLIADYGKAVVAQIEAAHAKGAPIDLTVRGAPEEWSRRLNGKLLPTGSLRLPEGVELTALPGYDEGAWWVQDAAAALPARILAAQPGERILDMCAAPGGKTLQLAAAGADVTAIDVSQKRSARIAENLARTGLHAEIVVADALEFEAPPFDAILLDAPCSATGTIRRHPDLPYAKTGENFPELFELQARLIDRAVALLKPGGRLVYCTCSLLIDEGEEQVRDALARHDGLAIDTEALHVAGVDKGWIVETGLRTRPDFWFEDGGMDGFFVTLLRKPA